MRKAKANTIESMGLQTFLDSHYGHQGGYSKFLELLPSPDSEIAKAFSTETRKLNYQTVGNWRRAYLAEATK